MPLQKLEKNTFVYLAYCRKSPDDFTQFRKEIVSCITSDKHRRDVVIDMLEEQSIGNNEVLLLSNVIRGLLDVKRHIHIVAQAGMKQKLDDAHLFENGIAIFYSNHDELIKVLNAHPDAPQHDHQSLKHPV